MGWRLIQGVPCPRPETAGIGSSKNPCNPIKGIKRLQIMGGWTDVLDAQPMSVVNVVVVGFPRLLEYLEPRYSLPSRKDFSKTCIHKAKASVSVSGLKKSYRCIPSTKAKCGSSIMSNFLKQSTF